MNSYSKHSLDNFIPIGKIIKPKGLKGEVKVFIYNIDSNSVKEDISFFINTKKECFDSYKLERFYKTSKYHLLKFLDIDDRDKAFNICDKKLYVLREDLNGAKGTYLVDLIGFFVKNEFGKNCGKVIDVINLPTNNALLINCDNKEIMIPIIDQFIELFDYENEVIVVKNSSVFLEEC